jgi:hypothetical protein
MGRRIHPPQTHPAQQAFSEAYAVARDRIIRKGTARRDVTAFVAQRLGVSRRTLYRWRDGVTSAPADAVDALRTLEDAR